MDTDSRVEYSKLFRIFFKLLNISAEQFLPLTVLAHQSDKLFDSNDFSGFLFVGLLMWTLRLALPYLETLCCFHESVIRLLLLDESPHKKEAEIYHPLWPVLDVNVVYVVVDLHDGFGHSRGDSHVVEGD